MHRGDDTGAREAGIHERMLKPFTVEYLGRILRDLVNATIGFEQLAEVTEKPSKSLHRMLSPRGNPSMDNLAAIFSAVRHWLKVAFDVHTIEAA